MFDVLDELEGAVDKVAADECTLDVERLSRLAERVEFLRLRAIGQYDRSGGWAADGYVSTASALRARTRCTSGSAHRSVDLARKLQRLPETAAAFGAGEITREHAVTITARYTPERAPMIEHIEAELVVFARLSTPKELQSAVKTMTDAFDGDIGARSDAAEYELNAMTLSSSLYGRGVLNGSFDTEVTDLALTALDAEMEALRRPQDTRPWPQRRAEAFESICRQYLAGRGSSAARGRGQTQVSVVWDLSSIDLTHPEIAALARADTAHGGRLSRHTLERLTCDCNLSRVITDGPSAVLDVGRITRTIPEPLWNALVARDRHCREPGCDRPPSECDAHHIWHWSRGGPTTLENLLLGCRQHHREWHIRDALERARDG